MPFDLGPLWSGGEKGFQWDFFDPARLRVGGNAIYGANAQATTDATPGDVVAIVEDIKSSIAQGADMITGGVTGTPAAGWSYDAPSNTVTRNATTGSANTGIVLTLSGIPTALGYYDVEFTVSGYAGENTLMRVGGTGTSAAVSGDGVYRMRLQGQGTTATLSFLQGSTGVSGSLTISGITVKPSTHIQGRQTSTSAQPTATRAPANVRNLIPNSSFTGATSGTPGTAPTGMAYALSTGGRTVTVSAAPTEFGGNKMRLAIASGRLGMSLGNFALKANETLVVSVLAELHSAGGGAAQARNFIAATGVPAGASTTYYVDGVSVGGGSTNNVAAGLHTFTFVVVNGTTPGNAGIRIGAGLLGGVSDDVTLWAPQAEIIPTGSPAERTVYQRTTAYANASQTALAADVFEPVPGGDGVTPNVPHYYGLRFDATNDALSSVWPEASATVTVIVAGRLGTFVDVVTGVGTSTGLAMPAGSGNFGFMGSRVVNVSRSVGDIVGVFAINRAMTQTEIDRVITYYGQRGAGGELRLDATELLTNPTLATDVSGYDQLVNATIGWDAGNGGQGVVTAVTAAAYSAGQVLSATPSDLYLFDVDGVDNGGRAEVSDNASSTSLGVGLTAATNSTLVRSAMIFQAPPDGQFWARIGRTTTPAAGQAFNFTNASLKHFTRLAVPPEPTTGTSATGAAAVSGDAQGTGHVSSQAQGGAGADPQTGGTGQAKVGGAGTSGVAANATGQGSAKVGGTGTSSVSGDATGQGSAKVGGAGAAGVAPSGTGTGRAEVHGSGSSGTAPSTDGSASTGTAPSGATGQASVDPSAQGTGKVGVAGTGAAGTTPTSGGQASARVQGSGDSQVQPGTSGQASPDAIGGGQAGVSPDGSGAGQVRVTGQGAAGVSADAQGIAKQSGAYETAMPRPEDIVVLDSYAFITLLMKHQNVEVLNPEVAIITLEVQNGVV